MTVSASSRCAPSTLSDWIGKVCCVSAVSGPASFSSGAGGMAVRAAGADFAARPSSGFASTACGTPASTVPLSSTQPSRDTVCAERLPLCLSPINPSIPQHGSIKPSKGPPPRAPHCPPLPNPL